MARGRVVTRVGRGARRLTQWIGPAPQGYVSVATTAAVIILSGDFVEALTVVRNRGFLSIIPEASSSDAEITGAVGIGVVSTDAKTTGIASVPTPFTNGDWGGWLYWQAFAFTLDFSDATGKQYLNWSMEVDSKAMRKVQANESLVTVAESEVGAFQISMPLRTLVKLS